MATEIEDIEILFPGAEGETLVKLRWLTKEEQNPMLETALLTMTTEIILTEESNRALQQESDDAKGKGKRGQKKKKKGKRITPKLSKQPSEDGQKTPEPVVRDLCIVGKKALEGYNEFNMKWWLDHLLAIYEPGKFFSLFCFNSYRKAYFEPTNLRHDSPGELCVSEQDTPRG
jgi:hypothetical protein